MGKFLRGLGVLAAAALVTAAISSVRAQSADPPARVGRIAFVNGTVSFHDRDDTNWQPAAINYPMTSGNALWTEPNGRAELFVGGTRIRMQGSTQLETLALTDDQFQLRISQGRIDVKPVGLQQGQPIEVLTPRGSAMLIGDGDYMVEAGTTDDATRVGVRAGSARVVASNGSELVVHAGEIGVLTGTSPPRFETVRQATPSMPSEWAARDRQIVATQAAQYVPTSMTGYESLDYYGTWSTVGDYGRVWSPRNVPVGWEPYRQGRWRWVDPWGWTWIDDQPWGFAPSHYGRWVNQSGRWYWVPPAREARPVYAPAVVGFVDVAAGAATLAIAASIGTPVGWFPLGPREVYVPPYTADRAYIRRVNAAYVRNEADIDRRIDYAARYRNRHVDDRRDDPRRPGVRPAPNNDRPTFINQRFATVVPQQVFVRGDRVDRAAIRVDADRLARVQAAPVAAPVVATTAPPVQPGKAPAPAAKPGQPPAPPQGAAVQRAPLADIPVLGRPEPQARPNVRAPGPQISRTQAPAPGATGTPAERQLPNLRTRDGREVERASPGRAAPVAPPTKPGEPQKPVDQVKPGAAAKPPEPPVATPPAKPGERPRPGQAGPAHPPEGKPGDRPQAAEPPKPPAAPPKAAQPPSPPAAPPAQQAKPPAPPHPAPQAAPPKAAQPPSPPAAPPAQQAKPPAPPHPAPQAAPPKAAQPPSPPAAPPAQQAKPPAPPQPAPQAAPPAQHNRQTQPPQARPPEPRHPAPQAAPPQQAHPPARPAPPPQQAKPPAPQPQGRPPEQAKQPPGRDHDDKGGDDRRR